MRKIAYLVLSMIALAGALTLTAGAASAGQLPGGPGGERPQPVQQFNPGGDDRFNFNPGGDDHRFNPRPEPVQFFQGCSNRDFRLLIRLLQVRHPNRWVRQEIRFLERECGFFFIFNQPRQRDFQQVY